MKTSEMLPLTETFKEIVESDHSQELKASKLKALKSIIEYVYGVADEMTPAQVRRADKHAFIFHRTVRDEINSCEWKNTHKLRI